VIRKRQQAIQSIRRGDKLGGRQILADVLAEDPKSVDDLFDVGVWLDISGDAHGRRSREVGLL
jgi:hypothetical protein